MCRDVEASSRFYRRLLGCVGRHGGCEYERREQEQAIQPLQRHIAADLDTEFILACAITPANRPEEEATPDLQADIERLPKRAEVGSLHVDRGYIGSSLVKDVLARRGEVLCKPWVARNRNLFTKADFVINIRNRTIECPAGEIEYFLPGSVVELDPDECGRCPQRARCTMASPDSGRTISVAEDEQLQHRLRKLTPSPSGSHALRERVAVEHRLAHLAGSKVAARATSAHARTSSTCAAPLPW